MGGVRGGAGRKWETTRATARPRLWSHHERPRPLFVPGMLRPNHTREACVQHLFVTSGVDSPSAESIDAAPGGVYTRWQWAIEALRTRAEPSGTSGTSFP